MNAEEAVEEKKEELHASVFIPDLEAAVKLYVEKWQDHPEGANALAQKYQPDLVKQELRPLVFEQVRLQVDEEMRVLLQNLKVRMSLCSAFVVAVKIGMFCSKAAACYCHHSWSVCLAMT